MGLSVEEISRNGIDPSEDITATSSGGDEFENNEQQFVEFINGDSTETIVTFIIQQSIDEQQSDNRDVIIPALSRILVGPFPKDVYNDGSGLVQMIYSKTTLLSVKAYKLPSSILNPP